MDGKAMIFPWASTPSQLGWPSLAHNDGLVLPAGGHRFFSDDECDRILQMAESVPANIAYTSDGAGNTSYSRRNSLERTLFPEGDSLWMFKKMAGLIDRLRKHFQFEVTGFCEGAVIFHYPENGYLDWHMDIGKGRLSNRKLSITVQLSHGDSYDGGDLEFMNFCQNAPRDRGSVVVFPSYLMHRVTAITRGSRHSMVTWVHGLPYR